MHYGKNVCLRALEISDLEHIIQPQNELSLQRWMGVPLPKSRSVIEDWLKRATVATPWKDGTVHFAIMDKKTNEFLGITRFYDIKYPHLRASLGTFISNEENRSKGYGLDTTLTMLWIGFHIIGLHSIHLDIMEHNERSIHVAEKAGFKRIGLFRETEFIEGEFKGLLFMDILRDEFLKQYPIGNFVGNPP